MAIEKNLLDSSYTYLTDESGEYVTVSDATPIQPLVTPNSSLVSKDRHIVARSSGATVVARSSGKDLYSRGGIQPLVAPKAPLISR